MPTALTRDDLKTLGLRALAAFLALCAPFFAFSAYRGHPIPLLSFVYFALLCALLAVVLSALCGRSGHIRQAILFTCLIALFFDMQFSWFSMTTAYLTCLGMLALFWLLRRHLSTILVCVFAVFLVSTVVVESPDAYVEQQKTDSGDASAAGAAKPQRVIHLLLDEHAGPQGIPENLPGGKELRREMREFFVSNGFRLFGNAISEYQASRNSISGILNFTAGPEPYGLYEGTRPFFLKKNAYFDALAEAGYRINVYQTTYMDYCRDKAALVDRCYTYRNDSSDWLKNSDLSAFEKLQLFFGLSLQLSDIAEVGLKAYAKLDRSLQEEDIRLPSLLDWPVPIALEAFDQVIDDATAGPGGRLYFAHILFPHGPFAFDPECRLRDDISAWPAYRPPYRKANNERERGIRYRFYFQQLRCNQRQLQSLFDRLKEAGLFADSTIIIHGDHGSRIFRNRPRAKDLERLTREDFLDNFATLFAAKSPAFAPGYDDETVPISQLLARAIGRPDLIDARGEAPTVYLEGSDDYKPWTPVPWVSAD